MPRRAKSPTTNWDDILLKECERIIATPTPLPNKKLRILKLGANDMETDEGHSTSSLSEESAVQKIRPVARRGRQRSSSQLGTSDKRRVSSRPGSRTSSMDKNQSAAKLHPKLGQSDNVALPPEIRQNQSFRNRIRSNSTRRLGPPRDPPPLLHHKPPAKKANQHMLSTFFGAEPLDISSTNAPPTVEHAPEYPDRSALSNFFGRVVDGAQRPHTLGRKLYRKADVVEPNAPGKETLVRQDPLRVMQLHDPDMRNKSLEELMIERFAMKLEDAICLVADARMNLGCTKWQHWGIELYDECERLYTKFYGRPNISRHLPQTKVDAEKLPETKVEAKQRPQTKVEAKQLPETKLEISPPRIPAITKSTNRRNGLSPKTSLRSTGYMMMDDTMSSSLGESGWDSTSGWSSLWEDGTALQGGFSRKTYDKNDEYTIHVMQEIQQTNQFLNLQSAIYLQMEATEQMVCRDPEPIVAVRPRERKDKVTGTAANNEKHKSRARWRTRFFPRLFGRKE